MSSNCWLLSLAVIPALLASACASSSRPDRQSTHRIAEEMVARQEQTNQLKELVQAVQQKGPVKPRQQPQPNAWTQEARKILQSTVNLQLFLKSIRRAYLDVSNASGKSSLSKRAGRYDSNAPSDNSMEGSPFEMWSKLKFLTDKERDEIDLTTKAMLRQLMHNIDALKQADQVRAKNAESQSTSKFFKSNTSGLTASHQLSAHRSAIILYLHSALAVVSTEHKDQQEIRIKKQLDRNPDLRHLANNLTAYGKDAMQMKGHAMAAENSRGSKSSCSSMFSPSSPPGPLSKAQQMAQSIPPAVTDEDDVDSILSPAQLQQFEDEQSALLKQHQSTLSSIKSAETSLLEISALQSELVVHLTQQNEITNKLWEDSLYVSGRVEEGNKQLIKARERNKEGRVWLLVFLIGASLTLLFLDAY